MLGKLMKYDLKSLNRFLVIIHAFLLLSAIAASIFLSIFPFVAASGIFFGIFLVLYIFMIAGTSFATNILIAVRFYKNLYSDEGYLTFTLPVTRSQLLLSKTLTGILWAYTNQLLICACIVIITLPYREIIIGELLPELRTVSLGKLVIGFLVFLLIDSISTIIMIYASITIGQQFRGHQVLGSIITYLGLTTVTSIVICAIQFITGVGFTPNVDTALRSLKYTSSILKTSFVSAVITSVILYLVTGQLMKKKIDLN